MSVPGVRIRSLRKSFRSFRRTHEVLQGIDLDVAPGEVVGLIGPNGAGKTTLMSCLLGFLHPDSGEIAIDDRTNDDLDVRRRTGFVPERMNFDRRATGWDFLRYMARLAEVPRAEVDERCKAMLDRLGLADAAGKRLSQYSRGMLQRIGMSQALIHQPAFLFLDEPTSGLDPNGVLLVRDLISEQKARGAAVLLNSHQLAEIEKVCDRVLFLHRGVIERAETLRHADKIVVAVTMLPGFDANEVERIAGVAARENVLIVSVETENAIAELVRELVASGAGVIDVRRHTTDLESIFRGAA
ncbi:MAG TPA: ABC transporter ATP-binding protein [Thermoanaerobaculia bacterium]|jgi:ABC-2 type transport system ATP-binding protein|nr:ABC transporter ATP-binding protein [Thermoanaerobaculia bacterium]